MPERSAPSQSPYLKTAKDVVAGTCGACMISHSRSTTAHKQDLLILASSFAGGIVVTFVRHPFDTVKVRLQTQDMAKPIYCKYSCRITTLASLPCAHTPDFAAGALDCAKKTVQWEGLTGLYKVGVCLSSMHRACCMHRD